MKRLDTLSPPPPTKSFGALALATVALLGAQALRVRRRARAAERRYPPRGRFVEVDGVRLHYLERGEGQPVVLLHGNGAMAEDFAISGVFTAASERYRVIAVDRPGFGYTSRPRNHVWTPAAQATLLAEALRQIGVSRPIVVGHSWGTLVALAMALENRNVAGLVLVSGYYYPSARADALLLSPPAIPLLGDVMRYTVSPPLGRLLLPHFIRKMFSPAAVTASFAAEFPTELALRPGQIRASAAETAMMIPAAANLSSRYPALALPVAIVAGAQDRIVSTEEHSERLHRDLPSSDLRLLEGVGHMVHHTAPHEILGAIERVAAAAVGTASPRRRSESGSEPSAAADGRRQLANVGPRGA